MNVMNKIRTVFTIFPKKCMKINIKRHLSSLPEESTRQNDLFNTEKKRQKEYVGRIEKIEVKYEGPPGNEVFVMNKNISTPYDCAMHLGEKIAERSVVALLNGESLWHMHRSIPDTCKLELLHYQSENPTLVNKTFWRSCSFLLGAIVKSSFKDHIKFNLHSFPSPNVRSGSFVYDIQLGLDDWKPTTSELKVLSLEMIKFCQKEHIIECLTVSKELAFDIFSSNPHKTAQIPSIAEHNDNKITLYRVDNHIDISKGPMIPNTNQVGRLTVANVIKVNNDLPDGPVYRFQGVALPRTLVLNHFAYSLIEERARTLNSARIPGSQDVATEDNSFVANVVN